MAKEKRKYSYTGHVSSGGTASLHLYFPDAENNEQKKKALAHALAEIHPFMLSKGYIPPGAELMSPTDLANKYGHTRQYWSKLLDEGKIHYKDTSSGRITCDIWVEGYLGNREAVDAYVKRVNQITQGVKESDKKSGRIICPSCGKEAFDYFVNVNNINGVCRAGCGFQVNTTN
ncbi:MAG: hypothetical protein ABIF06_00675 [bacterium]